MSEVEHMLAVFRDRSALARERLAACQWLAARLFGVQP